MLDALSAFKAWSRFSIFPLSSIRFAEVATASKVPAVSKRFTNRNVKTTLIIPTLSAPLKSNSNKTGARLGGEEKNPENSTLFARIEIEVIVMMPNIIAPGIFLIESTVIIKNPSKLR